MNSSLFNQNPTFPSESNKDNEQEILINNSINYFYGTNEIDYPYKVQPENEEICFRLEEVFKSIYDEESTHLAKAYSKEEREKRGAKGLSFAYSEVVSLIFPI